MTAGKQATPPRGPEVRPAGILLCEDDPRYGRLLGKVLRGVDGLSVVGWARSGEEALDLLASEDPDLLLLDLELPGMGGLEVIQRLGDRLRRTEVLVLTSFADEARVFEAVNLGAAGYLVKGLAPARLERAIREVLDGGTVIEPALARRFWNYLASARGRAPLDHDLTSKELEVLSLVARGLTNPEAAQALGATPRAVKATLEHVYRKLGVNGRVEAAVKALRAGLIEL